MPILRNETAVLLQQKSHLISSIRVLQNQKASLVNDLKTLNDKKQTLEAAIKTDKVLLEQTLAKGVFKALE